MEIYDPLYFLVSAQLYIFKSCLMNKHHGLDENGDHTFYAELFELIGFQRKRRKLKILIREYLNFVLITKTIVWQVGFGFEPLLF